MILYTNDDLMGKPCEMYLTDIRMRPAEGPSARINITQAGHRKVTSALWGTLDQFIITGHENGELVQWDVKMQEDIRKEKPHDAQIMDLQANRDLTFLISSSKDNTAKLFDIETLGHLKTYKTDRPVNSAAVSPIKDHVVLGGGQEAIEVTQTAAQTGKFEARFFHLIFEEEFARVKGQFGPINTIAIHPDGKSYASGAEDGLVRIHHFDNDYLDYDVAY
jgi:translation initiation factor 3 subunit I